MGEVFLALDRQTQTRVAIKRMLLQAGDALGLAKARKRFEEEVRLLQTLDHRGIPRVYGSFEHEGQPCLVMQYIDGTSLSHHFSKAGPEHDKQVISFGVELCHILEYLHGQTPPVLHRDIKPGNILVAPGGYHVFLVDFGLARNIDPFSPTTKTQVGTLGYCAVEQAQGHPGVRSDLYSLAVTLNQLLSGKEPQPFAVEPLSQTRPDLPEPLRDALDRAIAFDPADRQTEIGELTRVLERCLLTDMSGPVSPPASEDTPDSAGVRGWIQKARTRAVRFARSGKVSGPALAPEETQQEHLEFIRTLKAQPPPIYSNPVIIALALTLITVVGIQWEARRVEATRQRQALAAVSQGNWELLASAGVRAGPEIPGSGTPRRLSGLMLRGPLRPSRVHLTLAPLPETPTFLVYLGDFGRMEPGSPHALKRTVGLGVKAEYYSADMSYRLKLIRMTRYRPPTEGVALNFLQEGEPLGVGSWNGVAPWTVGLRHNETAGTTEVSWLGWRTSVPLMREVVLGVVVPANTRKEHGVALSGVRAE